MTVFYSGFNLYGQFINHSSLIAESFIDFTYDNVTNLELGQTFTVIIEGDNSVFLHGRNGEKTHQIRKIEIPNHVNVTQTACAQDKILILTDDNSLIYKVDVRSKIDRLVPEPLPNNVFSTSSIAKLACGNKINVALSQEGEVFTFSNKLNFEDKNVVDICVGREHCLILDSKGNVYSFGRGSRGQLGHGCLEDESEPRLVEGLAGVKISKIAAGGWHSCAASAEGDLYTWGWNSNGQLGIGKLNEESVSVMGLPQVVDFPDDLNVMDVACGSRHTVVLLDNGSVFGAGCNKYHQLGKLEDCKEDVNIMTILYDFSNFNVNSIKCGPWSTAIIVK